MARQLNCTCNPYSRFIAKGCKAKQHVKLPHDGDIFINEDGKEYKIQETQTDAFRVNIGTSIAWVSYESVQEVPTNRLSSRKWELKD